MDRDFIIFLLVGISIVNGIFSPAVFHIWAWSPAWYPSFLPFTMEISFYLASIICATLTLMASGVVAALFERVTRRKTTDEASLWVWFGAAAVLTLPATANFAGI
jgi:hypothetical protein